jgi:hypothetical protein
MMAALSGLPKGLCSFVPAAAAATAAAAVSNQQDSGGVDSGREHSSQQHQTPTVRLSAAGMSLSLSDRLLHEGRLLLGPLTCKQ